MSKAAFTLSVISISLTAILAAVALFMAVTKKVVYIESDS